MGAIDEQMSKIQTITISFLVVFFFNSVSLSDKEKCPIFQKDSGFPHCTAMGLGGGGGGNCLRPHYWAFN